ncbi:uncharacterized protein LOC125672298 [Ostrea edulis]|uniref:uncharacterized protein LOC125672298 n=1 Tax=Ostrea edulis TaxID=37623 RepID=UPI0024AEF32C|nr:uncharacterized protein LOC125672298 [Ostrea edulis]
MDWCTMTYFKAFLFITCNSECTICFQVEFHCPTGIYCTVCRFRLILLSAIMSQSEEDRGQHYIECATCTNYSKFYCNTCHLRLCEQHRDIHLEEEDNRKHEVVLYQERMLELPTEKCRIHPTRVIDLYCSKCKVPICSKCFTTDHKGHQVLDLEVVYNNSLRQCQKEVVNIQDILLPQYVENLKSQREKIESAKKKLEKIRLSMKKSADEIKAAVDILLAENNSELDVMEKLILNEMNNKEHETEDYVSLLQEVIKMYEGVTSTRKATEIFTLSKEIASIPSLKIPDLSEAVLPEFTMGTIEKQEIEKQFGKLSQRDPKEQKREEKEMVQTTRLSVSKSAERPNMKLSFSIMKLKEVKLPKLGHVQHLSSLPSEEVCASDMKGNLVLSDLRGNLLHKIFTDMSTTLGYHTVTRKGELVYTSDKNKAVYRVARNMTFPTLITTGDWEPGAIYSSRINGDLLVGMTRNKEWKVTRYSKEGEKFQDIQRDDKGRGLYRSISFITENTNGDVCVSDYAASKVVVVTRSGQYRFSYSGHKSQDGFSPYAICTDILGHILVCNGYFALLSDNYGSVHLLNEDGQFLKLLCAPDQYQLEAHAVCVDYQHNLWVGHRGSAIVTVYSYLQNEDN